MTTQTPIKIKTYRATVSNNDFRDLQSCFIAIRNQEVSSLSFEKLYRICWNAVLGKQGNKVYKMLYEQLEILSENCSKEWTNIDDLLKLWNNLKKCLKSYHEVTTYLNKNYIQKNNLDSIYEMGYKLWGSKVIYSHYDLFISQYELLTTSFFNQIDNNDVMSSVYEMISLSQFQNTSISDHCSDAILKWLTEYLTSIQGATAIVFFNKMNDLIDRITANSMILFSDEFSNLLLLTICTHMIQFNSELFKSNASNLLNEPHKLLPIVNIAFKYGNTKTMLVSLISDIFKSSLSKIMIPVKEKRSTVKFCLDVLEIHYFSANLIDASNYNVLMDSKLSLVFSDYLESVELSCDAINVFFDQILLDETQSTIDEGLILFKYWRDKDFFQKIYSLYLGQRLIGHKSVDYSKEMLVLSHFKSSCGVAYTTKMEVMIQDIRASNSLDIPGDIHPRIITMAAWPYKIQETYPLHIRPLLNEFEAIYSQKYANRKLNWNIHLGVAILKAHFDKDYELHISCIQMCVLTLFNEKSVYSLLELQNILNLQPIDLNRHLMPLCLSKHKLIIKDPKSKHCLPTDLFHINKEFKHNLFRVKIPVMQSNVQHKPTVEDRTYQIEAVVIKVMKSKKELAHNLLINEVLQELEPIFKADVIAIKLCIEQLIGRDFIKRKEDKDFYQYIA
eukprot:NODE_209_length_14693_cov_0.335617.p1 type:complete len:673 gc:universal NODE_209_length_14693_cov_0.335617:115-2133(+)